MIDKRISKTPAQLREEATTAAKLDLEALGLAANRHRGQYLIELFKWRHEQFQHAATTWVPTGLSLFGTPLEQWVATNPPPEPFKWPTHVCVPNDPNMTGTGTPSCRICGLVLTPSVPPTIIVGP